MLPADVRWHNRIGPNSINPIVRGRERARVRMCLCTFFSVDVQVCVYVKHFGSFISFTGRPMGATRGVVDGERFFKKLSNIFSDGERSEGVGQTLQHYRRIRRRCTKV